jgi:hypothetical protein
MKPSVVAATICVAFTLLANVGAAQGRADFSGVWTEDESARKTNQPPPAAGAPKSLTAPTRPVTIKQTPDAITIEHKWMSVVRFIYKLNGGESINHNGANTQTTRSRWEGNELITEGTSYSETSQGASTWKFKEVRYLTPKGAMAVETSNEDEDGKVMTTTQLYLRKRE